MRKPLEPATTDWAEVVREHGAAVWRLARRMLGDEADAGDCFQETFVAALTASRAAPVANWPGFLRRLCAARAIDLLRRRIRDRNRTVNLEATASVPARVADPADALAGRELAARLRAALACLPRQQAEVFTLAVIEELPHAEVAALCGLTPNHVGVLVHRARAELRELLDERPAVRTTPVLNERRLSHFISTPPGGIRRGQSQSDRK
jgi:RNA polymerase sigma-70 factor (ECF subfamily)